MSALDQAFIKAYGKEPVPTNSGTSSAGNEARAERSSRASVNHLANTQIENIYAAGSLYRIETPRSAEPEPVPPPHFGARGSRRLPLRYRLAQIDQEEAGGLPEKRTPQAVVQPSRAIVAAPPERRPPQRMKAQIPLPPPLPPSPVVEMEEPREVVAVVASAEVEPLPPREAMALPAEVNIVPSMPAPLAASPLPSHPPVANSVEVRESWDSLLGESPAVIAESVLAVWPNQEDFATSESGSLISIDLETLPVPPAAVTESAPTPVIQPAIETSAPEGTPAKTYRIDASHVPVPAPHEPAQPTVEDLIKPAEYGPKAQTPVARNQERPLVVSEEEAAELVGATVAPAPEIASTKSLPPAPQRYQPLVPAWEVDRFLWPALCEKLLRDDHSYFAQAGGKIASAVRDGLKSLAVTGSRRGEGRTMLALCIARSAAKAGLKVALVDADFSRPQLAASLGLEIATSWHDVALGKTSLAEAAIKSVEDNLTVLPLDASTAAAALSLADPRLTKTLRDLSSAFDLLVLDLGPTVAGDESLFPANEPPPADAAIVVRDLRYCTPAESQAIGERLNLSGIEAVGIAENFVPSEQLVA